MGLREMRATTHNLLAAASDAYQIKKDTYNEWRQFDPVVFEFLDW